MADDPQRVLILDDEPTVGKILLAHVVGLGYDGRFTTDPHEFLALHQEWKPTRVIVDLVMEEMDGLEVLRRLADTDCGASVIISSGMGGRVMDAARRVADAAGLIITGLLPKPYTRAELAALLAHSDRETPRELPVRPLAQPWWQPSQFAHAFQHAIDEGHIQAAFQPKIDCHAGDVVGYEALARWDNPEHGVLAPSMFVPLAERSGVVGMLTDAMLDLSLTWLAEQVFEAPRSLSLNISASELSEPQLDQRILRACTRTGVDPTQVILELTETSAMEDPVLSLELLTRLRIEGFRVSLDDFGTGYSSMVQLARMPFSEVKIDRSFVMNAATNQESGIVIRSVVDLAHALGMQCTAEGVEDEYTMRLLQDLRCDYAQGYFIAAPMVAADLAMWKPEPARRAWP